MLFGFESESNQLGIPISWSSVSRVSLEVLTLALSRTRRTVLILNYVPANIRDHKQYGQVRINVISLLKIRRGIW